MASLARPPAIDVGQPAQHLGSTHGYPPSPRAKSYDACLLRLREEVPQDKDPRHVIEDFKRAINMTPQEIEEFLASEESRIIELLTKDDGTGETFYEGDYAHMHQVAAYLACHQAKLRRVGSEDERRAAALSTEERYHLMHYGFDPLKAHMMEQ